MTIWKKDGYIFIQVNKHFIYDVYLKHIKEIGDPQDSPSTLSMYGVLNHLRQKKWWNTYLDVSFIKLNEDIVYG